MPADAVRGVRASVSSTFRPQTPSGLSRPATVRVSGNPEEGFVAFIPRGSGEQSLPVDDFFDAAFNKKVTSTSFLLLMLLLSDYPSCMMFQSEAAEKYRDNKRSNHH